MVKSWMKMKKMGCVNREKNRKHNDGTYMSRLAFVRKVLKKTDFMFQKQNDNTHLIHTDFIKKNDNTRVVVIVAHIFLWFYVQKRLKRLL